MKRNINLCIDLKTILQNDVLLTPGLGYNGTLRRKNETQYVFQEEAAESRSHDSRNPKLYSGDFVSLIRKKDGRYKIHMKELKQDFDRDKLPFAIFNEVTEALKFVD